mgnify:CR=1 FL=1
MIAIGPIDDSDVARVHANMWPRGLAELERMGLAPEKMLGAYLERNRTPFSFGIFVDGRAVGFMGARPLQDGIAGGRKRYGTWFMATAEFETAGLGATKAVRNFLAGKMREHPDVDLYLLSASDHPDADRWFGVLGFRFVTVLGVVRAFKYGGVHV